MKSTRRSVFILALATVVAAAAPPPAEHYRVRISAWYWLNSAPKSEWGRDFQDMARIGFTDVVLCWGLDAAAFGLRIEDTRDAMRLAAKAGMGAFMVMWHPVHNSLERRPEYQQVDPAGEHLFAFDTFNPEWRRTQWKDYLQRVARAYRAEPNMSGYMFDDSFGIGPIGDISGKSPAPQNRYISYNDFETKAFGGTLPSKPGAPRWQEWSEKRAGWWSDWARDTVQFIRDADPNREHIIYIEDEMHVLSPAVKDSVGLDFGRLARHFDAVGAYTDVPWDTPESGAKVAQITRDVLARTRAAVGPDKKIIYTFWVADIAEERKPGPARFPTVPQIQAIADAALQSGITHLDMYGYRIGEYRVKAENWEKERPGTGPTYPVTGQFPQKFLWDRPALHEALGRYLRGLNGR